MGWCRMEGLKDNILSYQAIENASGLFVYTVHIFQTVHI